MADLTFRWSTNIGQVATEIDRNLARIGSSVRQASQRTGTVGFQGPGGGLLGQGIDKQIAAISGQATRAVGKAGDDLLAEFNRVAKQGGGQVNLAQSVQSTLLGGTFDGPDRAKNVFNQVNERFKSLSRQLDATIQGTPLESQREALQQQLRTAQQSVIAQLQAFYREVAEDLVAARNQAKVANLPIQTQVRADVESRAKGAIPDDPERFDRETRDRLRRQLFESEGVEKGEAGRLVGALNKLEAELEQSARTQERLARELRTARDLRGKERPLGARRETLAGRNLIFDQKGRIFEESFIGEGAERQKVVRPFDPDAAFDDPLERQKFDEELERANQRRREAYDSEVESSKRAAQEGRELAAARDRVQRALELERQVTQDRRVVGGARRSGRFIRDRNGGLFEITNEGDLGQGVRSLSGEGDALRRQQAQKQLLKVDQRIAREKRKELAAQQRVSRTTQARGAVGVGAVGGGGGGGLIDTFFNRAFGGGGGGGGYGGRGLGFDDILTSAFSFSRYIISAAAFGAVFTVLQEVREALLDYEDSLTDLQVALQDTEGDLEGFADGLSRVSRFTGENPGAALDSAARGIRAFTDSLTDFDEKQRIGTEFADASQTLAVIAGKSLEDASGDLIAATNVFETSFDRINDAIASAKQSTGAAPDEIAQGLAAIGAVAKEAGFDVEETVQLVGSVSARTDQSGRVVAQRLSRALSSVGGSRGQSLFSELNQQLVGQDQIDLAADLRTQIVQLAAAYPKLSQGQQGLIRNTAGSANQREFLTLLTEMDAILRDTETSMSEGGEAAAEFNRKIDDLQGEVTQIVGSLKNIVVELADAGFFTIFAAAIEVAEPLLNAVDELLKLYNTMPTPLKTLIALTLQWAAAQALLNRYKAATAAASSAEAAAETGVAAARAGSAASGVVSTAAGSLGRFPRTTPRGGVLTDTAVLGLTNILGRGRVPTFGAGARGTGATFSAGGAFRRRAAGLAARFPGVSVFATGLLSTIKSGLKTAFLRLASFLATPAGLVGLGLAAIFAGIRFAQTGFALNDALAQGRQARGFDPNDPAESQAQQQAAASELREVSGGFFGTITDAFRGFEGRKAAERLEESAEAVGRYQERVDRLRQNALRSGRDADTLDLSTPDRISEGLKTLGERGRTARDRLDALKEALRGVAEASDEVTDTLAPNDRIEFQAGLGNKVADEIRLQESLLRDATRGVIFGGEGVTALTTEDRKKQGFVDILESLDLGEGFEEGVFELATEFLEQTGGEFGRQEQQALADAIFEAEIRPQLEGLGLDEGQIEAIRSSVEVATFQFAGEVKTVVDEYASVSRALSEGMKEIEGAVREVEIEATLLGGNPSLESAQFQLRELQELRSLIIQAGASAGGKELNAIDLKIDEARIAVSKAVRENLKATAEFAKTNLAPSLTLERLQVDIDRIEQALATGPLTEGERLDLEAELIEAERKYSEALLERSQARRRANIDPRNQAALTRAELTAVEEQIALLEEQGDEVSAEYFDLIAQRDQLVQRQIQEEISRESARRGARLDPRDSVGKAREELRTTLQQLNAALPGTQEYYDLRTQVNEARVNLAEEENALADAARRASVDPRSKIEGARADLTAAREDLQDTAAGTKQYFERLRSYRDAQIAVADAAIDGASFARQVAIDLTDPVATAQEELLTAQQRLAAAVEQGAPEDVLNELRIAEQNAQAQAEAAAFQQRFQDARTARDLGRISHAEYLAYLREERDRLQSIQDRTRQQQEQLNQVESALKSARNALDAQFNLGDIDIPTPFEARRAVEQQLGAQFGTQGTVINEGDTTIIIDGADLAKVRQIVEESVGTRAVRRLTPTGRRA